MLAEGQAAKAEEHLINLAKTFPNRIYVEFQRHGMAKEKQVEAPMLALADKLKLPIVATNEPYFLDEDMYEAHDALLCIADGAYVSQDDRRRLTPNHRFKIGGRD